MNPIIPTSQQFQASINTKMKEELLNRITYNTKQCGGKPCIRGMRIRVTDILEMLALNVDIHEMLADFPDLEPEDIQACLLFAAQRTNIPQIIA